MAPSNLAIHMQIKFVWWYRPYMALWMSCCWLTGVEPDYQSMVHLTLSCLRHRIGNGQWRRLNLRVDAKPVQPKAPAGNAQ